MRNLVILCFFFLPIFLFGGEKPIIILDPGHGGKDQGAKLKTCVEKTLTLKTAYLTKKHLEALGYRVVLTRARDVYLPLKTRVQLANRRKESLFVSIHYNSAASPTAHGVEIFYYGMGDLEKKGASKRLASSILEGMLAETKAKSRGVKRGSFQVIRETAMPGVLIEAGFISNPEERKNLSSQPYLEKLAEGIAKGVHKYVQSKP